MHHSEDVTPEGTAVVIDEDVGASRGMVVESAELQDRAYDMSSVSGTVRMRSVAHGIDIVIDEQTQGPPP